MKKAIVIILVVLAGAAAGYVYYQQQDGAPEQGAGPRTAIDEQPRTPQEHPMTARVPDGTLFYAGMSMPENGTAPLQALQASYDPPAQRELARMRDTAAKLGDAGRLLVELYAGMTRLMSRGEPLPGFGNGERWAAYTVGLIPVYRVSPNEMAPLRGLLEDAENAAGVTPRSVRHDGVELRRYPFATPKGMPDLGLLVKIFDDRAVLALDIPGFRDELLPLILDRRTPERSLADSGRVRQYAEKHGVVASHMGFINHRAIADALVGAESSRAGRMLSQVPGAEEALAPLRTPGCRQDVPKLAGTWPRTVAGMLPASDESHYRSRVVVEVRSQDLLASLRRLRGHIASFARRDDSGALLQFGLAPNVEAVAEVVTDMTERFTGGSYACEWLVSAQEQMRQTNTAQLGMISGMASGTKGISAAIYDVEMVPDDDASPRPESMDAVIALSATDAQNLVNLAGQFAPQVRELELEAGGEPVPVQQDVGGIQFKAYLTQSHLALFSGERGREAALALGEESVEANGLFRLGLDYSRFFGLVADQVQALDLDGQDGLSANDLQTRLKAMSELDVWITESLDIGDNGIVVDVNAHLRE